MGAFLEQIDRAARNLEHAGIRPGDRVGVLSENGSGYAAIIGGCLRIGAVVVPISTRYPAERVRTVAEQMGCAMVVASERFRDAGLREGFLRGMEEFVGACDENTVGVKLEQIGADLENEASIIMTSGSTGGARGVLHRVSHHYYSAAGSDANIAFRQEHRWLMSLPMYHVSGFSVLMRAFLHGGGVVFPRCGENLEDAILRSNPTHLSLAPVQLARLMDHSECVEQLRQMDAILVGGSSTPKKLVERALGMGLPIHTTYGSTEAASQVTTTGKGELVGRPGTSGRVLEHRKLQIGDDGEILVGGRTVAGGYVEAGLVRPVMDEDGWLHSGDLGKIDNGKHLYVTGRRDSMFISGGENIYPEEIEGVLEDIEGVERAVVVGIEQGAMGHRPVAFVKMGKEAKMDADALGEQAAERLERFKIPIAFLAWPGEMDGLGKVDRKAFGLRASRLLAEKLR